MKSLFILSILFLANYGFSIETKIDRKPAAKGDFVCSGASSSEGFTAEKANESCDKNKSISVQYQTATDNFYYCCFSK